MKPKTPFWLSMALPAALFCAIAILLTGLPNQATANDVSATAYEWGAGAESPPGSFALGVCQGGVQAADVNGDGRTDLLCAYRYNRTKNRTFVQLANRNGMLQRWAAWSNEDTRDIGKCRGGVHAADVNGDGRTDLLCAYQSGHWRNTPAQTFVQLANTNSTSGGRWTAWSDESRAGSFSMSACRWILLGDVNTDGKTDLICPYDYDGRSTLTFVQLAKPDGAGSYKWAAWENRDSQGRAVKTPSSVFSLRACKTMLAGDINGDGMTDLICPVSNGTKTRIWKKESTGIASKAWETTTTSDKDFDLNTCKIILTGDANNDGKTDLICPAAYSTGRTETYVASAGYEFNSWGLSNDDYSSDGFHISQCKTVLTGDVNNDGDLDLICPIVNDAGRNATWVQPSLRGVGYKFRQWSPSPRSTFDYQKCRKFLVGDVNNDGKSDLLCAYDYGGNRAVTRVQTGRSGGSCTGQLMNAAGQIQNLPCIIGQPSTDNPNVDTQDFVADTDSGSNSGGGNSSSNTANKVPVSQCNIQSSQSGGVPQRLSGSIYKCQGQINHAYVDFHGRIEAWFGTKKIVDQALGQFNHGRHAVHFPDTTINANLNSPIIVRVKGGDGIDEDRYFDSCYVKTCVGTNNNACELKVHEIAKDSRYVSDDHPDGAFAQISFNIKHQGDPERTNGDNGIIVFEANEYPTQCPAPQARRAAAMQDTTQSSRRRTQSQPLTATRPPTPTVLKGTYYIYNVFGNARDRDYGSYLSWDGKGKTKADATVEKKDVVPWKFTQVGRDTYTITSLYGGPRHPLYGAYLSWDSGRQPNVTVEKTDRVVMESHSRSWDTWPLQTRQSIRWPQAQIL